ncbi:hypothetical protein AYO38_05825 [bacterium SCGC AG-212-C10]|nr:hypothetical protein AYO38_05825 [bacterium SCGC AG-212-C10]
MAGVQVCLIRHGIAGERGPAYPDDNLRPLTSEGVVKMERAAIGLRELFVPDVILTSPLTRSRQTAEIVADACGVRDILRCDPLANGDDAQLLREVVASGHARIACTGHEPLLSYTLSYCLTGDQGAVSSRFRKGAAALVRFDGDVAAGRGSLEWLLQPAALRAITADVSADGD